MHETVNNQIVGALKWRYATKLFDPKKSMERSDLDTILEAGRLSPSSFGIEPWEFIVIENSEVRTRLRAVSFDQPKVTDAAYLIVIARRTDVREKIADELIERTAKIQGVAPEALQGLRQMVVGTIAAKNDPAILDAWVRSQVYIPLGAMVLAAALLSIDNCPMEGFDPKQVDEILGLEKKHLTSTTMLALGYRGNDPAAKPAKVRRSSNDVIRFV